MKLLLNSNNVVVARGNIETLEHGYKLNGAIYGHSLDLTLVDTELNYDDVIPQKNRYVDGQVLENPDYRGIELEQLLEDALALLLESEVL